MFATGLIFSACSVDTNKKKDQKQDRHKNVKTQKKEKQIVKKRKKDTKNWF